MELSKKYNLSSRLADIKNDAQIVLFKYLKEQPKQIIYFNEDKTENLFLTKQRKIVYTSPENKITVLDDYSPIDDLLDMVEKVEKILALNLDF